MAATAPFPIQPALTAVTLAYRNDTLIADEVLPRVPVSSPDFKYLKHTLEEGFTIPDTKVGRKGKPNEVDFSATEATASVLDYGLEDPVPNADIESAAVAGYGYDPLLRATEGITDLIALDREKRVADLVFTAANYPTGNKATLTGTGQWSDPDSDPINAILTVLDGMVMRPNIMVIGQAVWTKLRQHPRIIEALRSTGAGVGAVGVAMQAEVAALLEMEAMYVGRGWLNTAKRGQTASISRVWGKSCALLYRDRLADAGRGTTFGFTAQWGSRIAGSRPDPDIGLRGGVRVRVGESVKELITASDLGYLFSAAVA